MAKDREKPTYLSGLKRQRLIAGSLVSIHQYLAVKDYPILYMNKKTLAHLSNN